MSGEFKDVNLPELKLQNIKWPIVKKLSLDKVEAHVMNLNPDGFGKTLNVSYVNACEDVWKSIFN